MGAMSGAGTGSGAGTAPYGRPGEQPEQRSPLLRKIDAVTIPVPDLDQGLVFYRDYLGHALLWRNDTLGQVGLRLAGSDTEIVLTTSMGYAPNWLVSSVDSAAAAFQAGGGRLINAPLDIPVGRAAVVADPFDNVLVLVDFPRAPTAPMRTDRCSASWGRASPIDRWDIASESHLRARKFDGAVVEKLTSSRCGHGPGSLLQRARYRLRV